MSKKAIKEDIHQLQKRKTRFARGLARSSEKALMELEKIPDIPWNMSYFLELMRDVFVSDRLRLRLSQGLDEGKKIIGVYCIMIPEELIYAAGAIPVRLCGGSYEASCIGDDLVPRDCCPVVKASMGFTSLNTPSLFEMCDIVIVPTTCDAKRKMGEELSKFKEVWMIEVPHIKDGEGSKHQWREQLFILKKNLETMTGGKSTGKKIRKKELRSAIRMAGSAVYEARRLYEIRKSSPPVIYGCEAMLALNAYSYDTACSWTKALSRLNDELEERIERSMSVCQEHTPRILLAGSPSIFPNWKIPSLIEQMGAVIVTDESCMGSRYIYDPVGTTERSMTDMMTGIASRYLMPCVCPSFAPNDDRLFRLLQMVEDFRVHGVLYLVLKGCVIYDFEIVRVEKTMREKGIPLLRIETDYNPEDVEQLRTRIEAFVEMLGTKNKNKE